MPANWLTELTRSGTVHGRDATPQDWQDALRTLADQSARYLQLDDTLGEELCRIGIRTLVAADKAPKIPW